MSEIKVRHQGVHVESIGVDRFTVGGSHSDNLVVGGWAPARLQFVRRSDGWGVFVEGGRDVAVNGVARSRWLIGSNQRIEADGAVLSVELDAIPPPPAPHTPPPPPPTAATGPPPKQSRALPPSEGKRVSFGRAADNDFVINDLRVRPHHAELRVLRDGTAELRDLGSRSGTYVDGRLINGPTTVALGSTIAMGSFRFRLSSGLTGDQTVDLVRSGEAVDLVAESVGVVIDDLEIVRSVSLRLQPKQVMAVLGPSGSGKSTIVRALSGGRPPERGSVTVDGEDLYGVSPGLRQQVGYVPQDDILHSTLEVESALRYAAELRFPMSTPEADRHARIGEVLGELGLADRARHGVEELSGGQRKRVNVATELLTAPSLIFLDEPTSGLDPGYEKEVMQLLRRLADEGRTIVVVTHSLQSLDSCDQLLIMAKNGQQAYFGPPEDALDYFGVDSLADVFLRLEREDRPWQDQWEAHSHRTSRPTPPTRLKPGRAPANRSMVGQWQTLVRRYVEIMTRDSRQTLLVLMQGPLLALLMLTVMGSDSLRLGSRLSIKAPQVLLALVLGAVYIGASNAVREIVKELPILRRERAAGLGFIPYLASKVSVLGAITLGQAFILVFIGTARQGTIEGLGFFPARFELFLIVTATGLASMALALAVSAVVSQQDKAMLVLPVVLFAQFVLSDVSFALGNPVLRFISWFMPARWGFSGVASSSNVSALTGGCLDRDPTVSSGDICPAAWGHGGVEWFRSFAMLGLLSVLFLGIATGVLFWRERRMEL